MAIDTGPNQGVSYGNAVSSGGTWVTASPWAPNVEWTAGMGAIAQKPEQIKAERDRYKVALQKIASRGLPVPAIYTVAQTALEPPEPEPKA